MLRHRGKDTLIFAARVWTPRARIPAPIDTCHGTRARGGRPGTLSTTRTAYLSGHRRTLHNFRRASDCWDPNAPDVLWRVPDDVGLLASPRTDMCRVADIRGQEFDARIALSPHPVNNRLDSTHRQDTVVDPSSHHRFNIATLSELAHRCLSHSVFKFAAVGVLNTLLTLVTIFSLKKFLGVPDVPANFVGYLAGLACSFILNKRWTFRHDGRQLAALARFTAVFAASYLLNLVIVIGVIKAGGNDYWAHVAGMPFYTISFYFGCRYFAFSRPEPGAR